MSDIVSPLSIVIVNFNSGAFLEATTSALLTSLPADSELIVVDNSSSDSSVGSLRAQDNVTLVQLDSNYGFGTAANIGAARARNEFIVFLNPDAFVPDGTFSRMTEYLIEHPESGLCGGLLLDFQGREQAGSRRYDPTLIRSCGKAVRSIVPVPTAPTFDRHHEPLPSAPVYVDAISGACMMVRRQVHQNIGGFDEGYFLHFEDLDYCRRVREGGWKITFIPDAPIFHFQGVSGAITEKLLLQHKQAGLARYLDKFASPGNLSRIGRRLTLIALRVAGILGSWSFQLKSNNEDRGGEAGIDDNDLIRIGQTLSGRIPLVLVFGPRSDVGDAINARLNACGHSTGSVSTRPAGVRLSPGAITIHPDLLVRNHAGVRLNIAAIVSACPIWELPAYETFLGGSVLRGTPWVVLSSTSAVTKLGSSEPISQAVVSKLCAGEEWLARVRSEDTGRTIIARPTLIYGGRRNRNINKIREITRVLRIKFSLEFAQGSRRPIHCDDIAEWATALLCLEFANQELEYQGSDKQEQRRLTIGKAELVRVDLAGGESVTFAEMVKRTQTVACSTGIKLHCRRGVAQLLFSLVNWLPWFREVPKDFVSRLEKDFLFSSDEAIKLNSQVFRRFYP